METAEFLAACFWPLVISLGVLPLAIRDWETRRLALTSCVLVSLAAVALLLLFDNSSIIAVLDTYLLAVIFGVLIAASGLFLPLGSSSWGIVKKVCVRFGAALMGTALVGIFGYRLICDFIAEPLLLEGKTANLRVDRGRRSSEYLVDIGGQTVKVTTPVYERLKYLPLVRAEVGRGSRYVYRIEYLSN